MSDKLAARKFFQRRRRDYGPPWRKRTRIERRQAPPRREADQQGLELYGRALR